MEHGTDEKQPLLSSGLHHSYEISHEKTSQKPPRKTTGRTCRIVTSVLLIVLLLAAITVTLVLLERNTVDSVSAYYDRAAVVSDTPECSQIGVDILRLGNGSAADAAIATALCMGLMGPAASGIGGGMFMVIYDTPRGEVTKEMWSYDARERAPAAAYRDMFENITLFDKGRLSIAVPSEVKGLHEVWKRYGRVPWRQLVEPAIKICQDGARVTKDTARKIRSTEDGWDRYYSNIGELLIKPDGTLYVEGDVMRRPRLARTLARVADDPESFYSGTLMEEMVKDIQDAGGILDADDFRDYQVKVQRPLSMPLTSHNLTVHSPSLPSGGPILNFMLKILDGYNFTNSDISSPEAKVNTYQKIAETFKFGFALRSHLGDEDFVDVTQVMNNLTSVEFIDYIRSRIRIDHTQPFDYYGSGYIPAPDSGTAHISVVAPDGGAASITTSVNSYFGSFIYGKRTGIIFNNQMDDFSVPGYINFWGLTPSPANFIEGRKRPLSSMSPSLLTSQNGEIVMATGGAGGSHITTGIAFTVALRMFFNFTLKDAIDEVRIHHQFMPDKVQYEKYLDHVVVEGLRSKGHTMQQQSGYSNIITTLENTCLLSNKRTQCINAVGDGRRQGASAGF